MRYKDSEAKLKHAKRLFEDCVDHAEAAHLEAHMASRFYHNTNGEGQWEIEDLQYLRDQRRPAFSFNIVKTKVDTFLGMYADAQRTPKIAASGKSTIAADVLDMVKDQMLEDAGYDGLSARQIKTGTIEGECSMQIEVVPSEDDDEWIKINLYRVMSYELHWDIASVEPDRSDARYLFWHRWFDEDEFKSEYPKYAERWDTLHKSTVGQDDEPDSPFVDEVDGLEFGIEDDYDRERWERYYFDRNKNKVRVIRYEYKTYETKYYAVDTESGEKTEIDKETGERVKLAAALGAPIQYREREEEVTKVCEFVGELMLAEYDTAGPFKGFSVIPYCYDVDEETGTSYGLVRNLMDPQRELNKSKSLEIEYLAQATAPGTTAEEGAIPDIEAYRDESRTAGGVALVSKDALVAGRVQERQSTPPSPAVMNRTQGAMQLLDEVSTIPSAANLTAAEHMQSGVTVAIRYNKSRQSVSNPFAHFELSQKMLVEKVTQAIINVMPDSQLQAIVEKSGMYRIEGGRVIEVIENPDVDRPGSPGQGMPNTIQQPGMNPMMMGPQQPPTIDGESADLRDLRTMKWSLDMEYTSENSTLRMLELEILMQLVQAGVPVDPEVLVERSTNSRSVRERLKAYVDKAQKAQAEGQQAEAQAIQQQNEQFAQIEMAKVQETQRHNMATEQFSLTDMQIKERLKHLEIWEKADETEKDRLFDVAKFAVEQRNMREAQNSGASA